MAKLNLSGELIPDEWAEVYRYFGIQTGYYCPADVRASIDGLEPGEELVLQINSVGGSVDGGTEIYSIIQGCGHPVRVEIQSLAASAASYMIMAADRIAISVPAQMMIHRASWGVSGNAADHQWAAQQLQTTDESILDTYVSRCGEEHREELRRMMEEETYLSAHQCLELGLVDEILGEDQEEGSQAELLVASVTGNVVRAMSTLPDIRALIARRDRERAAGRDRLELEKARYI